MKKTLKTSKYTFCPIVNQTEMSLSKVVKTREE